MMTIYRSDLPAGAEEPYSNYSEFKPMNIAPRKIQCDSCKYQTISDLPAPRCGICGHKMITVVPSHELA